MKWPRLPSPHILRQHSFTTQNPPGLWDKSFMEDTDRLTSPFQDLLCWRQAEI